MEEKETEQQELDDTEFYNDYWAYALNRSVLQYIKNSNHSQLTYGSIFISLFLFGAMIHISPLVTYCVLGLTLIILVLIISGLSLILHIVSCAVGNKSISMYLSKLDREIDGEYVEFEDNTWASVFNYCFITANGCCVLSIILAIFTIIVAIV